jgi:hypothetical protein
MEQEALRNRTSGSVHFLTALFTHVATFALNTNDLNRDKPVIHTDGNTVTADHCTDCLRPIKHWDRWLDAGTFI